MARVSKHLLAILKVCAITGKTVDEIQKWDTNKLYSFLSDRNYVWKSKTEKWLIVRKSQPQNQIPVIDDGIVLVRFIVNTATIEQVTEEMKLGFELLGYAVGPIATKPARYNSKQMIAYVTLSRIK